MWLLNKYPVEYIYLPDGRVIPISNDTTDQNLFEQWIAESMTEWFEGRMRVRQYWVLNYLCYTKINHIVFNRWLVREDSKGFSFTFAGVDFFMWK